MHVSITEPADDERGGFHLATATRRAAFFSRMAGLVLVWPTASTSTRRRQWPIVREADARLANMAEITGIAW